MRGVQIIWPEIFVNGEFDYKCKAEAIADAYCGWGICHGGNKPIDNFGKGMAFIGAYLGISPIEEELHKLSKKLKLTD